jgi:hypothetical protein
LRFFELFQAKKSPARESERGSWSLESPRGAHGLSQGLCTERSQTATLWSVRVRVYFKDQADFTSYRLTEVYTGWYARTKPLVCVPYRLVCARDLVEIACVSGSI